MSFSREFKQILQSGSAGRRVDFLRRDLHRRPVISPVKTPETGSLLELTIHDLSRSGPGVSRDDQGRVIFVPGTIGGDRVRVRIVSEEKRYATGELVELLEPSPDRISPRCPVFGKCGGCTWQHVPYALQWRTKVEGVKHALRRVELSPSGAWTEHPAERIWEYRNRVQARGFQNELGFHARGSIDRVPVERCEIARPEINAAWSSIREEGRRFSSPYKVEVEVLPDGQVRQAWNSRHGAGGFRQVHDEQNEVLRSVVSRGVPDGSELWDLYGGTGNLSLPLLPRLRALVSVDVGAPVTSPEILSGGTPTRFERRPVGHWARGVIRAARKGKDPGGLRAAILDPPRAGLGEDAADVVEALKLLGVQNVVAVGCDPDSWARDLKRLVRHGWQLLDVDLVDLFPQTPHVESVARLFRIP